MSELPRRIVILGGSGFIGRRLADRLRRQSIEVNAWSSADCNLLSRDSIRESFANIEPPYALVHCAGLPRREVNTTESMLANIQISHNLTQELTESPRSIVFLSSTDLYGLPAAELPITETTAYSADSYYAASKEASENILRHGSTRWTHKPPTTCLRLPGVYGPGDQSRSVVGAFAHQLAAGQTVKLTGKGETLRDFLYVDDLCDVIEHLLREPQSGVFNVATGVSSSIREVAAVVANALETALTIENTPDDPARNHPLQFDISKLLSLRAFRFRDIKAGVRDYLREELSRD